MNTEVLSFLQTHRVAVLSVLLDKNLVHGATLYYSFRTKPLQFYFATPKNSRKSQSLSRMKQIPASLVIGFQEKECITFQAEGKVSLLASLKEVKEARKLHYGKFPQSNEPEGMEMSVMLTFKPTWWRFTDFSVYPVQIIHSHIKNQNLRTSGFLS